MVILRRFNSEIWRTFANIGLSEIRNFKSEKWVSMFYIYLVENFFLVILKRRNFFSPLVLTKVKITVSEIK